MAIQTIQKKAASKKTTRKNAEVAAPAKTVTRATLTRKLAGLAAAKRLAVAVAKIKLASAVEAVIPATAQAVCPAPEQITANAGPAEVVFTYSPGNRTQAPESVFIAGDFNGWDPQAHPLHFFDGGDYRAVLRLAPGTYQYKFVVDGEWAHDPRAEQHAGNEHGTLNSIVRV